MANDRKLPRQPPPLPPKLKRWQPGKWITEADYPDEARYVSVSECVRVTTETIERILKKQ